MRLRCRRRLQEHCIVRKSSGDSVSAGSRKDFSPRMPGQFGGPFHSRPRGLIVGIRGWKLRELSTDELTLDESWPWGAWVSLVVKLGAKTRLDPNQMCFGSVSQLPSFFNVAVKSPELSCTERQRQTAGHSPSKTWAGQGPGWRPSPVQALVLTDLAERLSVRGVAAACIHSGPTVPSKW